MDYTDDDLTFYLVVYRDFDRAVWCLDKLRAQYPVSRVVIDVDGDDDPAWAILRDSHQAEVTYGDRLFAAHRGGALLKRMLSHHSSDPARRRWMFRIDTDTETRRRFRYLSPHDYFGAYKPDQDFVQGGCTGLTRHACEAILASELLDNPKLGTDHSIWYQCQTTVDLRVRNYGLISLDWMLNWVMGRVGIQGKPFDEVASRWRRPIPTSRDCAMAHPCKVIPVNRPI